MGCRTRAAASELLRVVAGSDAEGRPALVPDPAHRAPGRGAHLHPTSECWELAVRRRALPRALRSGVPLSDTPLADYLNARLATLAPSTPHHRPEAGARSS
ncbi:MAG TPA: YlxR family protein [Nocardioides sp.]|nr:YlxR family protein [Nocardioides sp.]